MSINEKVLDAIELLTTDSVKKAKYDRTIQAQIISCEDATIGKYKCRYQDAIIYAYTNNADMILNKGSYVYILVPENDMKKEKTILGASKKLGINYISQAQGDQAYEIIGNNNIISNNKFYLNTINKDYRYILYQYNNKSDLVLDIEGLNQYIKKSSSLIVGAVFKTTIPPERQHRGHYGITYNLRFLDNTFNKEIIRSYTIDEDNMVDNPYRLNYGTRQYQIFDIDGSNFIRVESIEIFNKDFPNATGTIKEEKLNSGDIEITSLEISGAMRMSEKEINGIAISFYTPQGTFFTDSSTSESYKTITAQVKVKGKLISAAQKLDFYWGIENASIFPSNEYYNKYLGRGWKCLNNKNIINETESIVEWVPAKDTYILNFENATARDNKIKVAVIYNNTVFTKEINIQNLSANTPILTIESDSGTKFYYDIGHPTLTCKINNNEPLDYEYHWAYEDNMGILHELFTTTEQNIQYNNLVNTLNNLKAEIADGTKFINAEIENLNNIENAIKAYDSVQRIEKNKIYNIQISTITSFGIFKCSVYNNENIYLGTASLTLTNILNDEGNYSLVINNGSAVFQYNENGIAPNSKSLNIQQEIQELSFTVYDNLGQPIDSNIIANTKNCKIRWQFPIKESMLVDQKQNEPNSGTDATQTYKYYDNKINLTYGIAQRYDIKKQRNQIKLIVDYKGISLTAETAFTFTKQGDPGTNGSEYLVKLVPNTKMTNPPLWPVVTKAGNDYILNYGLDSLANETNIGTNAHQLFKAQLWHSGELVWEGFSAVDPAADQVTNPSSVHWEILRNKYNSSAQDDSAFEITDAGTGQIAYLGDHLDSAIETPLANIIKCSINWQGKLYYGTIPITTAWVSNDNYRINLKDYTGFRYVVYTSDGVMPQYDNSHPFEFICKEKINNIWEDISTILGDHEITYIPMVIGNYLSTKDGQVIDNSNLLEILTSDVYRDGCAKNQWKARPASRYNGICINVAICCIYKQNDAIIGKINVPIHYLLNKYGMANINEWDGNSIQINNEGGFILSPQMGTGHKENDNSFTGILMGETRLPNKQTPQIGLLGYNAGSRTFFLNSKNGSALFGKSDQGQIVIDPSTGQKKALIYSGNFWKEYNSDGDYDGLPKNYTYRNEKYKPVGNANKTGLLIDLTTPEIFFGTGNFYVTKDGYIHASAGGDIGGWKIDNHSLYSSITKTQGRLTIDAGSYDEDTNAVTGPGKIYSHNHDSLTNIGTGFYLSYDGLSFGGKVKITNTGQMYLGNGAVNNTGSHWTIDGDGNKSYIAYGGTAWSEANNENNQIAKIYLGTDGFSIGNKFSITPFGELKAYNGKIGGWTIEKNALSAGSISLNSNGSISGGTGPEQYSWSIATNGKAVFSNIEANGGKIGGWIIGNNYLQGGNLILRSSGAIEGKDWSISADGLAHFNKIYGQIANGYTLNGSGIIIGNSNDSFINPSEVRYSGNSGIENENTLGGGLFKAYKGQFDQLYADKAEFNEMQVNMAQIDELSAKVAQIDTLQAEVAKFPNITIMNNRISIAGHLLSSGTANNWYVTIDNQRYPLQGPHIWGYREEDQR